MRRITLSLLLLFTLGGAANAACSGSGTTWSCTSGSTAANIQSAISSSTDGATITMANGSYSWTTGLTFSPSKATTLICATVGGCTVTGAGIIGENATCSGNSTKLQRVSGFVFSGSNNPRFWWAANGSSVPCTRVIRVDHNTFTGTASGATVMWFGHFSSTDNYIYGVIDHNTVSATTGVYFVNSINGANSPPIGSLGGPNNLFIENNTITSPTMDGGGGPVCVDGWGGAALVVRYNTFTNCRVSVHGVQHAWGPRNLEVYNNSMTFTSGAGSFADGYRAIHHQGSGTFMVFNNTVNTSSGKSGSAIALLHYRSWTTGWNGIARCTGSVSVDGNRAPTNPNFGYPCFRQPGRDPAGNLFPVYVFNNKFGDGANINLACEAQGESNPNTCVNHLVNNRDFFNASGGVQTSPTSPFNGTSGVGFGTLANRPPTCSIGGTQAADAGKGGVGYYATDGAQSGSVRLTWNASTDNVGVTGYRIYRDGAVAGTSTTPLYIDNAASPSAHTYTVSAYDAAGNESARSAPVSITVTPGMGGGVLYRCVSTNTWAAGYSPYPYPHPVTLQ